MNAAAPLFVIVAHQDDWQLFMGKEIFGHLRDPNRRVIFVITTAGDAGDREYHWKSRLSGAVFSVLRPLPVWSPYDLPDAANGSPTGFRVVYARVEVNGKTLLAATIGDTTGPRAIVYLMHLPDGGGDGAGFAPRFESLKRLHAGVPATAIWPPDASSTYASWSEFEDTLAAIVTNERGANAAPVSIYAANADAALNPGDHADHTFTSMAVTTLARRDASLVPVWFSTYAIASMGENLDAAEANDQRYAYGGGYMAAAAGFGETWRTGTHPACGADRPHR